MSLVVALRLLQEAIMKVSSAMSTIFEKYEAMTKRIDYHQSYAINPKTHELVEMGGNVPDIVNIDTEGNIVDRSEVEGWVNVSSRYTGQWGAPDSMHPSESLSGGMVRDLEERGEEFCIAALAYEDEESGEFEIEEWAVYVNPRFDAEEYFNEAE